MFPPCEECFGHHNIQYRNCFLCDDIYTSSCNECAIISYKKYGVEFVCNECTHNQTDENTHLKVEEKLLLEL